MPIRGRAPAPPPPRVPVKAAPPPRPGKAATVWAAEQTFGSTPGAVLPPKPVKPPPKSVVVTKRPTPPPVPLETRYQWAKQAPVNPTARDLLVSTMTPKRRAALAESMTPQLPAAPHRSFGSSLLHDAASLELLANPVEQARFAYQQRQLPGEAAAFAGHAARAAGRYAGTQMLALAASLTSAKQQGPAGLGYGVPAAQAQQRVSPQVQSMAATPLLTNVVPNVLAEGVGGVYAHRHPLYALGKDLQYAKNAFNGTTQLGGLLVALPQMTSQQRNTAIAQVFDQASASFRNFSNLTVDQAFQKGQRDPMNGIVNAMTVLDPAGSAIGDLRFGELPFVSRSLRNGFSLKESIDHVHELRLGGEGGITVERPLPRGWVSRQAARGGYRVSRALDRPGVINTPFVRRFTETGRAARQLTRLMHQSKMRDMAKAASIYRDIRAVTRGRLGKHLTDQEIRLVLEHQMSQGHTYEEGLQAVAEDMRQMLGGREFETAGPAESLKLQRARARVDRFAANAERANQRQRSRSIVGIAKEQTRRAAVLGDIATKREAVQAEMRRINADETITDAERATQLAEQQSQLRALDRQMKTAKEDLGHLALDEPAVESPARTQFAEVLAQHPNFDQDQTDALLAVGDARARAHARMTGQDPGAWWDQHQFFQADEGAIPEAAFGQVREPYQVFDEKKMSGRLKSKLNPRYRERGVPANPRTRQLVSHVPEGTAEEVARIKAQRGLHVLGPITPEAWVKRVLHVMPTKAERHSMAKWYEAVQPLFDKIFGKDADRVLRAFAVSQANASPTSGLQAVLKVADKLNRNQPISKREISTVVKSIEAAFKGEPVTKGVAAKLSDFIDSLIGLSTRTWMGHDPLGGGPAAIDIHALRDLGFVDRRLVAKLKKRGLVEGQDFVVDSGGVATGPTYERASEKYQQITDHLNKMNDGKGFDGRNDWKPAEVQALGWSAIQKFHGVTPEDLQYAVDRSTQRIQAPTSARDIRNIIRDEGGYVTGSGPGWADGVMTEQMADRITQRLANEHGEARTHWLSNKSKAKTPMLRVRGRVGTKLVQDLREAGFTHRYKAGDEWVYRSEGKVDRKLLDATLKEHEPDVIFNGKVQESVKYGERTAEADAGARDLGAVGEAGRELPGGRGAGAGEAATPVGGRVFAQHAYGQGRDVRVTTEHTTAGTGHAAALGGRERAWLRIRRPGGPGLVRFTRLSDEGDLQAFTAALERNGFPGHLTEHGADELARNKVFLSEDGHTGVVVTPEGDMQNLFNNAEGVRGAGSDATELAVAHGAQTLDAFERHTQYYRDHGFEVTGRTAWNDAHAPENWDYERFGRPDIVHMAQGVARNDSVPFHDFATGKANALAKAGTGFLSQARRGDLLGAVHYLDGPAGQRIIYLTEHADTSTVLHEMIGHAAGEMKRYYPQEFAPVEEAIGRPFEQWTVPDHETFARWTERYFLEGHAPTPELVDAFGRIKSWMRAIYAGVKQRLGGRLDPAMRNLLDTYLGGYDDPGVARIGFFFGEERAFSEAQAARGVAAQARTEMETLQKAQSTRAFNKSVKGMRQRLDTIMRQTTPLSEEQQLEADTLSEKILWSEANDAARQWRREQNLTQKLGDIEKAMRSSSDTPEHQAAREAMAWAANDRERILHEVFGDQFDEMFANRNDLISDWLVSHNLLEPDFVSGTAHYFPATVKNPKLLSNIGNVHAPLVSRVIGKMKTDRLTLYKRNNMTLWQRGDWNADPMVLFEAHQRAQGFAYMNEMKNILYGLGRDLTLGEAQGVTPLGDVIFVNTHGTPIGTNLRAAIDDIQTGSRTHDVQNFLDGVEGGDNDAALSSLDRYQQSILLDPKEVLPEGLSMEEMVKLAHDPNAPIRVLPRSVVEMLTPPIRGSSTMPGRALDFGMTLARWALIYANAPGYMLVNGIGNLGYLLAHQGPFRVPWMINDMRRLFKNRQLYDRIGGETGELPLLASVARGRGPGGALAARGRALEQSALSRISAVDSYPRALAWMYEARKRGYGTDAKMMQLLDSSASKAVRDRMVISDLARNHMVDFDRLTPFERNTVTRALFVYPWVRGATAWPFWFARQYPVRTAAVAAIGQQLEQRREKALGPAPPWYEGLFPISTSKGGRRAEIMNAAPFSPTATPLQSIETLHDVVSSLLGHKDNNTTAHLVDMLAPQWRTAIEGSTGINQFGKNVTLLDVLKGSFPSMIPGYRLANAMVNPDTAPKIYTNVSRMQQFERTFLRITPSQISIPRLNAQTPPNQPSVSEQIQIETDKGKAYLKKMAPDTHWDNTMQKSTVIRVTYEAQRTQMEKQASKSRQWDPKKLVGPGGITGYEKTPNLSPLADAHLIYVTVKHFLPGLSPSNLPEPQTLLREMGPKYRPGTYLGNQALMKYRDAVYSAYAGTAQSIITKGQQYEGAQRAGIVH